MIEENKRVHATNDEIRSQLEESESQNLEKDDAIAALEARVTGLTGEVFKAKEGERKAVTTLKEEQLGLGKKNVEADMLRRESMTLDMEGRKLREDWDDKVFKLAKAEEARDHYKVELHKLAHQYADIVEKLSFLTMDHKVPCPTLSNPKSSTLKPQTLKS